jgi:formate dehydrogenase subunit gamma
MTRPRQALTRNGPWMRVNHWITGLCFVLLMLSGLAMFHPALFFLSDLFDGGQSMRALHPWFGIVLVISFAGLVLQVWRDNRWRADDTTWLKGVRRVLVNDEAGLPEVGRFNAGQKLVFWGFLLLVLVLLVSGLAIWEVYFFTTTSIATQRIALLIHSLAAIGIILAWIVHVYAALWIKGTMRAMLQGWVMPGWAWRHHRKWLRSLAETGSSGPRPKA